MQDNLITFLKGYYIFFKDKLLIYFMIFIFCKDDSWVKKCKICFFKFISIIPKKERPNKDNILRKIFSRWSSLTILELWGRFVICIYKYIYILVKECFDSVWDLGICVY